MLNLSQASKAWRELGAETASQRRGYTPRPRAARKPRNLPLCSRKNPLDSGSTGCPALALGLPTNEGRVCFYPRYRGRPQCRGDVQRPESLPKLSFIPPFTDPSIHPVNTGCGCQHQTASRVPLGVSKVRVDPGVGGRAVASQEERATSCHQARAVGSLPSEGLPDISSSLRSHRNKARQPRRSPPVSRPSERTAKERRHLCQPPSASPACQMCWPPFQRAPASCHSQARPPVGRGKLQPCWARHTHVGGVWAAVPESLEGSQSPTIEPLDGCPTWAQHFPDVASFTPP